MSFSQVNDQILVTNVDVPNNLNCSALDNECQHLNGTTFMPFVMIADKHNETAKVANLSTYIVPEFYSYRKYENGTEEYEWFETVECTDYYINIFGSFENIPRTLQAEMRSLHNTTWKCPNLPQQGFVLQNDPFNYDFGTNFNFVVNFCFVSAERQDQPDPNCITDQQQLYDYIDKTRVSHKFVRQYFNPVHWLAERDMEYIAEFRMENDFEPVATPTNYYIVETNQGSFYDNKIFDWSSFSFIPVTPFSFWSAAFQGLTFYTNF